MRTALGFLVCAAMVAGVTACSDTDKSEKRDNKIDANRTETNVTLREDTAMPSDADVQRIRTVLAETVDAAMTKGGLDDVVERLSKGDRDRIGKYASNSYPDLDGRIDALQKTWKDRYGQTFKMADDKSAFTDCRIRGDQYHASVVIPAWGKFPAYTLKLVNEGTVKNAWRIDAPDALTGQMLKDRMLTHLTSLGQTQAAWPNDMHDGYRFAAYEVLQSVANVDLPTPKQ
jgi:hypothetical protein